VSCCDQETDGGGSAPAAAECEAVVSPTGNSALDSTIIQTALDGPQQTVCLRAGTYVLQFGVTVPAGKVLKGANAILQRQPQVSTTTATALVSGVTTVFVVAAAAGLKVGDDLGFDGGASNISAGTSRITNIAGNTITVSPAVQITDAGPTTVFTTSQLVHLRDDSRVEGVWCDGNEPNNAIGFWLTTASFLLGELAAPTTANRARVSKCRSFNEAGEGLLTDGADDVVVEDCVFDDIDGNGVHFGGSHRCNVIACSFRATNQNVAVLHADGCIAFSNDTTEITIEGCHFRDSPLSGVGSIDQPDNNTLKIIGCDFEGITTTCIEGISPADNGTADIQIIGNSFVTCGPLTISETEPSTTEFQRRWLIEANTFVDTVISMVNARQVDIVGNTFRFNDNSAVLIGVARCQEVSIVGNKFVDGQHHIYISANAPTANRDHLISGNTFTNPNSTAITIDDDLTAGTTLIQGNKFIFDETGFGSTSTTISVLSTYAGDFLAIVGNSFAIGGTGGTRHGINSAATVSRTAILSNHIVLTHNGANDRGIKVNSNDNIKGNSLIHSAGIPIEMVGAALAPVCQGNTAYAGAGNPAIQITTAASVARVLNNQYQGTLVDTSGGTAILRDNDALP